MNHLKFADEIRESIEKMELEISEMKVVEQYHRRMAAQEKASSGGRDVVNTTGLSDRYDRVTDAIRDFLRQNPTSSAASVCDALVGRFKTTSNPKTIIYSTLASFENRDKAKSELINGVKHYTLIEESE